MAAALRLVDAHGRAFERAGEKPLPPVNREPAFWLPGRLVRKEQFQDVVAAHDIGLFQPSTWLVSQMLRSVRVASAMRTRLDGLTGTEMQWIPGKNNDKGRAAVRDIAVDWPLIASATTRAQLHAWGLFMGASFAQKHWYVSSTGRRIPRLEPYSSAWANWDAGLYAYRIRTQGGVFMLPSPALLAPGEMWEPSPGISPYDIGDPRVWVVHEPYGLHSWRSDLNLLHSLWESYFGYALANNDMNRVCEKQGRGQMILEYPKSTDTASRDQLIDEITNVGAEGTIPLEQYGREIENETAGYKLYPLEWSAQGWEIVSGTKESNASEIAIAVLGHNTTGETKGAAGAGGGARVGDLIRGDIRIGDTEKEKATYVSQVIRDWAAVNYGDPDLAPIPVYVTEEPRANVQAGQTVNFLGTSLDTLYRHGADTPALQRQFQVPMREEADAPDFKPAPAPTKSAEPKPMQEAA